MAFTQPQSRPSVSQAISVASDPPDICGTARPSADAVASTGVRDSRSGVNSSTRLSRSAAPAAAATGTAGVASTVITRGAAASMR